MEKATIRLEKETDLMGNVRYYIMDNDKCIASSEDEEKANSYFETAKKNLKESGNKQNEILKEYTL